MKKRILSVILTVVMVMTMLPVATTTATATEASGTCGVDGDNLTWTLSNGVLTISGEGEMKGYTRSGPWSDYVDEVVTVVIESGVTSIGGRAFYKCTSIESVTIPDSVTTIGNYAFRGCTSLTKITMGNGVTSIGYYAFCGCSSLVNIVIPDSVISIGYNAFNDCTSLTSATIGAGVTSIGDRVFEGCTSLESIEVDENNTAYLSKDGVLFTKDMATLIRYPEGKQDESYSVPDGVTSIEEFAFYCCTHLTNVTMGDNVDGVTTIGRYAFCGCTSLMSATIGEGVTTIGDFAFDCCTNLTDVTIGESMTEIGKYAFSSCTSLKHIVIPDSVTTLGDYVFGYCTSLESAVIGTGVTSIPGYAFKDCTSLMSIEIPDNVTVIGGYAFSDCTSLVSVTIGDGVQTIGKNAFGGCENLMNVVIPASVEIINSYAFYNCKNITNVYFEGDMSTSYDGSMFHNVTATAYYPANNSTWDDVESYGWWGNITWVAKTETIAVSNEIIFGVDQWKFANDYGPFGYGNYYITDEDLEKLESQLSNTDWSTVKKYYWGNILNWWNEREWSGSCFGMSATVILFKMTDMQPSDLISGATTVYSIEKEDNDLVESFLNFYHVQQQTSYLQKLKAQFSNLDTQTQLSEIKKLASSVSSGGSPFLIQFGHSNSSGGHAVVAYGIEYGSYFNEYDSRILIYDSGFPDQKNYLYFKSGTDEWYFSSGDYVYDKITCASTIVSVADYFETSTEEFDVRMLAYITSYGISGRYTLLYNGQAISVDGSLDDRENGFVTFFDCNDTVEGTDSVSAMTLTLPEAEGDYSVIPSEQSEFIMNYENSAAFVYCEDADQIDFSADGSVSMTNVSGEYSVSIVFNDGYTNMPWYETTVSGSDSSEISLSQTDEGILVEGDLSSVEISVTDHDGTYSITLETEQDSVLIVNADDTDETDPVIMLDTNGDNTYETEYVTSHTVTFNSNGGSSVSSQTVTYGSSATEPTAPTRTGYTFAGWYTAASGGTKYDFSSAVTADMTLYAHWTVQFTDVSADQYFYDAVQWAVENGVTTGTDTGVFSPFVECERCQIVTFLWRAAGSPTVEGVENPFTDVHENDYFYMAVLWAVKEGITTGTDETTFSPYAKCERCQVITFIWRYAGKPSAKSTTTKFTDVASDAYYATAVAWALENGITTGTTSTKFGSIDTCERCMVVTFLYRYMG